MFNPIARRIEPPVGIPTKRDRKARRFSQTPGTSKVDTCRASALQKTYCKRERSYQWRDYSGIMGTFRPDGKGK